ncbi:MAG TPA: hypothetical protein VGN19_05735 [Pedococcus sp.]|jgi:hypothetical protein|nr:hypothetical protein [Pedococcus sp.]
MSRSVYVGRDSRGYVSVEQSRVIWHVEAVSDSYQFAPLTVAGFISEITDAVEVIAADGIDPTTITVALDYEREPDYGDDRIVCMVVVRGERPATKAEVDDEQDRLDKAQRQRKADEAAWLRQRLADVERGR